MIGKLAGAMGRRGILRGALGLGAAVGIAGAGQVSRGPHMPQPMPPSLGGLGLMQQGVWPPRRHRTGCGRWSGRRRPFPKPK